MYTYIFQCKQHDHSKVNLDTLKLAWNVFKDIKGPENPGVDLDDRF